MTDQFTAKLHKAEFHLAETDDGFVPRHYFFRVYTMRDDPLHFDIGLYVGMENMCDQHAQLLPVPYYDHGRTYGPDTIIKDFALIEAFLSALNVERKASGADLTTLIEGIVPIIKFNSFAYL